MSENKNTQALQVFKFEGNAIRTVMHNGETWWVAKDICIALGLANHRQVISMLPNQQKDDVQVMDAIGRNQNTNIISEAGMYKLAFRSNKPEAERFTDWVTSEVLPSIRKTGSYSIHREQITDAPLQGVDALMQDVLTDDSRIDLFIKGLQEYQQGKQVSKQGERKIYAAFYPDKQQSLTTSIHSNSSPEKPAPTPEYIQSEILRHIDRLALVGKSPISATGLRDYMPQFTRIQIEVECSALMRQGVLKQINTSHTSKYERLEGNLAW